MLDGPLFFHTFFFPEVQQYLGAHTQYVAPKKSKDGLHLTPGWKPLLENSVLGTWTAEVFYYAFVLFGSFA